MSTDRTITLAELQAIETVFNAATEYWATHTSKRDLKQACRIVSQMLDRHHAWTRRPELDKRIAHDHDYNGDAWERSTGEIKYTAVGYKP